MYLYSSDFDEIENIISNNFVIIEKVDKLAEQGDEKFGYGAIHYIVKLGGNASGPRYDDLKDLSCEIQVRTVLQDAWSIINHHLIYKKDKDIPSYLKRKINSLSGLFETADDQFDRIRDEREKHIRKIEETLKKRGADLDNKINIDNIIAYLQWKFPKSKISGSDDHASWIFEDIDTEKYRTIGDLESVMNRTEKARKLFQEGTPDADGQSEFIALGELAIAIALDDPSYRLDGWDDYQIRLFEELETEVEEI